MHPALAALILAALEAWRVFYNKPEGWEPTAEDIARLRRNNRLTAEDYERAPQTFEPSTTPLLKGSTRT